MINFPYTRWSSTLLREMVGNLRNPAGIKEETRRRTRRKGRCLAETCKTADCARITRRAMHCLRTVLTSAAATTRCEQLRHKCTDFARPHGSESLLHFHPQLAIVSTSRNPCHHQPTDPCDFDTQSIWYQARPL